MFQNITHLRKIRARDPARQGRRALSRRHGWRSGFLRPGAPPGFFSSRPPATHRTGAGALVVSCAGAGAMRGGLGGLRKKTPGGAPGRSVLIVCINTDCLVLIRAALRSYDAAGDVRRRASCPRTLRCGLRFRASGPGEFRICLVLIRAAQPNVEAALNCRRRASCPRTFLCGPMFRDKNARFFCEVPPRVSSSSRGSGVASSRSRGSGFLRARGFPSV